MNSEDIFEYKWFDNYFKDENREAYFIKEQETYEGWKKVEKIDMGQQEKKIRIRIDDEEDIQKY